MSVKRIVQLILVLAVLLATLGVAPMKAEAWSGCGSTYVVQSGDWLAKIAKKCGVSLSDLTSANSWTSYTYYIYPGQILNIPGGGYVGPVYSGCGYGYDRYGSYYIVCRGDTLSGIAAVFGESAWVLAEHNHIYNLNLIYAGQWLRP